MRCNCHCAAMAHPTGTLRATPPNREPDMSWLLVPRNSHLKLSADSAWPVLNMEWSTLASHTSHVFDRELKGRETDSHSASAIPSYAEASTFVEQGLWPRAATCRPSSTDDQPSSASSARAGKYSSRRGHLVRFDLIPYRCHLRQELAFARSVGRLVQSKVGLLHDLNGRYCRPSAHSDLARDSQAFPSPAGRS